MLAEGESSAVQGSLSGVGACVTAGRVQCNMSLKSFA